jgi:hypothetical protein
MQPPPPIIYDEVVIRFSRQFYYSDSDTYQATIRAAHAPVNGGAFRLDMSEALENFLDIFVMKVEATTKAHKGIRETLPERTSIEEARKQASQNLGTDFFSLLPQTFQDNFRLILQRAIDDQRGIRLILEASALDPARKLLVLPWEILFGEARLTYFAQSQRMLIVRRLSENVRRNPLQLSSSFRVLHTVSVTPNDKSSKEIEALGNAEKRAFEATLKSDQYTSIAPRTSIESTDTHLTSKNNYEIFHFTGHGNDYRNLSYPGPTEIPPLKTKGKEHENLPHPDPKKVYRRSFLTFVANDTERQPISGERLRYTLNKGNIQVVVLNACHGGTPTIGNAAMELVYGGTPYVVAMQGEISVKAAEVFSKSFYQALQTGKTIDVAVAMGRERIALTLPTTLDWALPTLYTAAGVSSPSSVVKVPQALWFGAGVSARRWLPTTFIGMGGVLLFISLLLAISDVQPALPDPLSLLQLMGWTLLIPIGVALYTHYAHLKPRVVALGANEKDAFLRAMESALIGFGTGMFMGWMGVLLAVALGFWALLTPVAHFLFFIPFIVASTLLSYSQAYGHGNVVIDSSRLGGPSASFFLPLAFIAALFFLYGPILLVWFAPFWATPPVSTAMLGMIYLALAYALKRDDAKEKSEK